MSKEAVVVDVRDDIRSGREPFAKIMQAVARLQDHEDLLLIAPFEPAPLFGILQQRGFGHTSNALPSGDYEVRFSRNGVDAEVDPAPATTTVEVHNECGAEDIVEVDARGLEPPQPLVKILEALAALGPEQELRAHTDRRPMHLYSQLESRGYCGETKEQEDGSFITYVSRR